ncbi:MAG: radical SAM protein [Candidatus Moraniibacteriota bacterium]
MSGNEINTVWLTINRKCNFRCLWCCAEGTNYGEEYEMSLQLAIKLLRLGLDAGAKNIIILGGEPTLWKPLPKLIAEINQIFPEGKPTIVTNGVLFSSDKFLRKFSGLKFDVELSLKAGNEAQYKELTRASSFKRVKMALQKLSSNNLLSGVSVTVSNRIINNLVEMAELVADNGGKSISYEMCQPSFSFGKIDSQYLVHPAELAGKIVEVYPRINRVMNGNLCFQMSVPFCLFPEGFIENLENESQMIIGCHVFSRNGLIFNSEGGVLLCNCLHHIPIGYYGDDFSNAETFRNWWNRKDVVGVNERLLAYPSENCENCGWYNHCGGGCCLQWFSFNPQEVL